MKLCTFALLITILLFSAAPALCGGTVWEATAAGYGGVVSGYRYGWDIQGLNDDEQWDVLYTPCKTPRAP